LQKPRRDEQATPPVAAAAEPGKEKRLVAEVPERIHRQVKQHCLDNNLEIREFVMQLLAAFFEAEAAKAKAEAEKAKKGST
jgi:hypothetical protein